jgi:hypothetical protein
MVPTLPNLDGLIGLANNDGVDIRPTLIRVLTDLYVQRGAHTREEEARYTELALSLLSRVDVSTRAAVAKKLATFPMAPRPVVQKLSRDVFEVAEPILLHSPCLKAQDLLYILKEFDSRYAAAIAARVELQRRGDTGGPEAGDANEAPRPPAPPAARISTTPETREEIASRASAQPAIDRQVAASDEPRKDDIDPAWLQPPIPEQTKASRTPHEESPRRTSAPSIDHPIAPSGDTHKEDTAPVWSQPPVPAQTGTSREPPELSSQTPLPRPPDTFFSASPAGRRLMLSKMQAEGSLWRPTMSPPQFGEVTERLETAAYHRKVDEFTRELESALGVSYDLARQVVEDDGGEPFVVAARALGIPASIFLRITLFLNPKVGQSVDRVFSLVKLFDETTTETAQRLVETWRERPASEKRTPRYQAAHWDDQKIPAARTLRSDPQREPAQQAARSQPRMAEAAKGRS